MGRRPLCLAALFLILWVASMNLAGEYQRKPLPDAWQDQRIRVRGQVYRQEKKNTNQIYLKNNSILSGKEQQSYDSNIVLFLKEDTSYGIGNILEVSGVAMDPEPAGNPGQFDTAGWYQSQKVGMLMTRCQVLLADDRCQRLLQAISEVRAALRECFYRIAEEDDASLMCAVLLGDKNGLDEEIMQIYQEGGISHVLAISGMHISMIGMLFFQVFRYLGGSFAIAGGLSGSFMGLYCIMIGMSVSTARAFLMFLVYLGAQILGRTYDLKSSLALAVILLLLQNPLLLFQGGFQLSMLAVAGLAYIYPVLKKRMAVKKKAVDSLLVILSVQLAIFPCVLYHYFEFSAAGILVNFLILPCMSALLIFGLISCAAGIFWVPAGTFLFAPCHYIRMLMEGLCEGSGKLPGVHQVWGRPEWESILIYYGILASVLILMASGQKGKKWLPVYGSLLLMGTAGLSFHRIQGLEMTFLDVGQGDSIFWRTADGTTFLCDGGSSSVRKPGKYRIVPFLKCKGVSRLDVLFLSHMDEDHVNGVEEILKEEEGRISVGCLVLPDIKEKDERYLAILEAAAQKAIPVVRFHEGMTMQTEKWTVECLAPGKETSGKDKNAASMVLAVQYGSFRALLTGDIEGEGEKLLTESGKTGRICVLKVAHHGSDHSTAEEFLWQAEPAVSVISCGRNNSYGHPGRQLLERLEQVDTEIYNTMDAGAVTVGTDGEYFTVEGFYGK